MIKKIVLFSLILMGSALLGSLAAEWASAFAPAGSAFSRFFSAQARLGVSPRIIDLSLFEIAFGFTIKVTFLSVVFALCSGYLFAGIVIGRRGNILHRKGENAGSEAIPGAQEPYDRT